MFDLTYFTLIDMAACGAALRQLGVGAKSMEEAASRVVRFLYAEMAESAALGQLLTVHERVVVEQSARLEQLVTVLECQLAENARLRQLAAKAAVAVERHRLARDLHDSVTQALYSQTLYAEAAARLLEVGTLRPASEWSGLAGPPAGRQPGSAGTGGAGLGWVYFTFGATTLRMGTSGAPIEMLPVPQPAMRCAASPFVMLSESTTHRRSRPHRR